MAEPTSRSRLIREAALVGAGETLPQRQDSLMDQFDDLMVLAVLFGLYDAADYLKDRR